jgi:acetate kinase
MSTRPSPILVINNGSSSLKFSVIDPKSERVLSAGLGERIGTEQGLLKLTTWKKSSIRSTWRWLIIDRPCCG